MRETVKRILLFLAFLIIAPRAYGATFYLSSVDGDNADNGTTWALAKANLCGAGGALSVATTTGDVIYVDSAHAEAPAAAITCDVASAGLQITILSVNRNGMATGHNGWLAGASVTVGANGQAMTFMTTTPGRIFMYGVTLSGNNGSNAANDVSLFGDATDGLIQELTCDTCTITVPGSSATAQLLIGGANDGNRSDNRFICRNCTLKPHNNTGVAPILVRTEQILFSNLTIAYNTAEPTTLFEAGTTTGRCRGSVTIVDSDISGYEAAGNYFDISAFSCPILLRNVKLSATPGIATGTWATNYGSLTMVNVDSGDTHNLFSFRNRLGTLTTSAAIYHDTGAQFDAAGVSWSVVTNATTSAAEPFVVPFLMRWSASTSSTLGIRIIRDNATGLTNNNVWAEFEYLDSASFPNGTLVSNRTGTPFDDASPTTWGSDSDTWTGTGGFSNANKQIVVSSALTPAESSVLRGRLYIAAASSTIYVDPLLRDSANTSSRAVIWTDQGSVEKPSGGTSVGRVIGQ
jgi:hypothetical protein